MTDTIPAALPGSTSEPILLAFSGGLDTSFLVPWLKENYGRPIITVTVDTGGIDAEAAKVLEQRRTEWQAPPKQFDRGWLQIYRRNVGPLAQGAVLTRESTK